MRIVEPPVLPRWSSSFFEVSEHDLELNLTRLPRLLEEFSQSYRGKVSTMNEIALSQALRDYERILTPLQQAATYAEAKLAANAEDPAADELMIRCDTLWETLIENAGFFEREFGELSEDAADNLLGRPAIAAYANYLKMVRAAAKHMPPAPVSDLLARLDPVAGWERHARKLLDRIVVADDGERLSLGSALPTLYHPDPAQRKRRCAAISAALTPEVGLRASALTELTRARVAQQQVRGLDNWLSEENTNNQLAEHEVTMLLDTVVTHRDLVHRYYEAKAMSFDRPLTDADRYAPLRAFASDVSWGDAVDVVLGSFATLGPDVAAAAGELIAQGVVDAEPRRGKRRGALTFSMPGGQTCVLLNFTGTPRDVLTLAHELGHAVHARLSGHHGVLSFAPPTILAETVALFAEAVTMRHYLRQADAPTRTGLLARWLEDQLVAAFRQLSLHAFEASVHSLVGAGELPDETALGDLWLEEQQALYGPAVSFTQGYRHWWSYLDNLYFAPGTRYAYAFGQLTAISLLAAQDDDPAGFGARFEELLRAGGSRPPTELLGHAGLPAAGPACWQASLSVLDAHVRNFAGQTTEIRSATLGQ